MKQCPGKTPGQARGFTLIETLVVLTISVGLVILMAQLYRSVGYAALRLKGNGNEWSSQSLLRQQLHSIFTLPQISQLSGSTKELKFLTWHSHSSAGNGKPVFAYYRYDAIDRALYYRERPLIPWWQTMPNLQQLSNDSLVVPEIKLLNGIDDLEFRYIPFTALNASESYWQQSWQQLSLPRVLVLRFNRAGQSYTLWMDLRNLDA